MKSPAYILGALDVLVKSGEVSPAYAAGVADVLVKDAGMFWDSGAQNFHDNYMKWQQANPGQQMTPDQARQMALDSRNWYSKAFSPNAGWGNWAGNRAAKWTSGIRRFFGSSNVPSYEAYDRELQDMENQRLKSYADTHYQMGPQAAGALQDAFVRDADFRVADAQKYMSDAEREAKGLNEDYANKYRTDAGNAAIRGGVYKPKHDKLMDTPGESKYGKGIPRSFGTNKQMYYRTDYLDPTS